MAVVSTLADRIERIAEVLGISHRELARRTGLKETHLGVILKRLRAKPDAGIHSDTMLAMARGAGVRLEWLSSGEGEMFEGDRTPTPPTSSAPRPKDRGDHWFPDHIEDWFAEVLQSLGDRRYTGPQVRAAKVFIREGAPKLPEAGPRTLIMGALEAARELDETGREMDPGAILTLLIEKNAPVSVEEMRLREEARRMYEEGLARGKREAQKNRAAQKKKVV